MLEDRAVVGARRSRTTGHSRRGGVGPRQQESPATMAISALQDTGNGDGGELATVKVASGGGGNLALSRV